MKLNLWLCAIFLAANTFAQDATNAPAGGTPPATNAAAGSLPGTVAAPLLPVVGGTISTPAPAPAATNLAGSGTATNKAHASKAPAPKHAAKATSDKKGASKKSPKVAASKKTRTPAEIASMPLVAGPATVIASNVNVRGQAKLNSEVLGKVQKGENLNVLEEIVLKKSGPEEPSAWAKITLPPSIHPWVNASFISSNSNVSVKRLKLRGGPGENYSVLGMLKFGDTVKETSRKGDWMEIEAPNGAYAFVAAQYLRQEAAPVVPVVAAASTNEAAPPATATVTEPTAIVGTTTDITPPTTSSNTVPEVSTNIVATLTNQAPEGTNETAAVTEPPPPRIVQREGIVRGTVSIQAPTRFELISPQNRKAINYLYSNSAGLDLQRYKGMHIIVTGEESLDERWGNTPVITIQRIQVLE